MNEQNFTEDDLQRTIRARRTWGRWGPEDQAGAINLITAEKRRQAASLVRSGRNVSLSRPFPKTPSPENLNPAQHWMRFSDRGSTDYIAIAFHGQASTHIDALCHMWWEDGLWNGGDPKLITPTGAGWGSVDNWSGGIVTRGVLLNVPKFRGLPFVDVDKPVGGAELRAIAEAQGVQPASGDALVVYSGRENFNRSGRTWGAAGQPRPGLHPTCLDVFGDWDISVLVWDMMDALPSQYSIPYPVHAAIYTYGVALVDNALLEPLAWAAEEEGRGEFMLTLAPLVIVGGTGSPINPIAMF